MKLTRKSSDRELAINSKLQNVYWYQDIGDLDNHYDKFTHLINSSLGSMHLGPMLLRRKST